MKHSASNWNSHNPHVGNDVSEAAQAYLAQKVVLTAVSPNTLHNLRAEEEKDAILTNEPIISAYVDTLEKGYLGGVPVLLVTPKNYDTANEAYRLLYFFGGAFVVGSPDVDLPIIARLAARLGVKIVAPCYRRAPEHPYPAAVDDGLAVYQALLKTTNPHQLSIVGESAGGNLALAVALRAAANSLPLPASLALLSPWCDLTPTGESQQIADFDPTLNYEQHLKWATAVYAPHKDPRISPLYAAYPPTFPPTLITTGTRDLFLSDCKRLVAKLQQEGISAWLRIWEGMWHVFEWYRQLPEAERSMDEICHFIQTQFDNL
ncbi:MAG: alpha/beta hydrolase [Chloroflexota bacterium]